MFQTKYLVAQNKGTDALSQPVVLYMYMLLTPYGSESALRDNAAMDYSPVPDSPYTVLYTQNIIERFFHESSS